MAFNRTLIALSILLAVSSFANAKAKAEPDDDSPLAGLEYRLLGPAVNGRITRVGGVAGDPNTFYASAAQGGWPAAVARGGRHG